MFIYDGITTSPFGFEYARFYADKYAMKQVLTMVQRGVLDPRNVKSCGSFLAVNFINKHKYQFSLGNEYHLYVVLSPCEGDMVIDFYLNKDAYVAPMWRMPVEEISIGTKALLGLETHTDILSKKNHTETEEYSDDDRENETDTYVYAELPESTETDREDAASVHSLELDFADLGGRETNESFTDYEEYYDDTEHYTIYNPYKDDHYYY